jgi:putative transposase
MLTIKSYRFRIYPNKKQCSQLMREFGSARFVYNYFLARKIDFYKENGKGLNYKEISAELTLLKKDLKFLWLKDVNSIVLQQSLRNLDHAFQKFFHNHGITGFPKFKNKSSKQSIRFTNQKCYLDIVENKIILPKIGKIRMINFCKVDGRILRFTVSKTKSGKYFVSITTEQEVEKIEKDIAEIGIDVGLKSFLMTSKGLKVDAPKYFYKSEKRLARLQRTLSRKQKNGKNRDKAKHQVAVLHEKIASQRNNFINQLTTFLTKTNSLIVLEDLNIKGMMSNHCLAKSIADASWSEFGRQLKYKSIWYGCEIVKIGRFEPSSKTCSICGWVKPDLTLTVREWTCPECGTFHDRDLNAAKNILSFYRGRLIPQINACGDTPVTGSMKQE